MESEIWQNMFKVCSHFCTVATNVLSIQHCIYTSSCSCHIGTQHSSFQHRTLHRQYHTHATRPSEHQTTQAQTIKTSTTCVMQVGTPLVLQPKQLSSICRIAVVTHQYNITNTNAGKLHHPKVVSTTQLPVYLTTTSHKTTLTTTLTTSTTHHLFGNRTPALRSASTTTYVQHTSITEHTSISTFLPTFSQTPQQHDPAGHTIPHSMQPQCATAAFRQPFAPTPQQQPQQLMGHTVPQPTQAPFANSAFTQPLCFQHTTSQHSHAMSSATTTLQCSHTQSSALTTTIWIIRHLPVYTTVNKHNTSTTSTSHAIFTAISNHYSFNSTTESQQAQPYTISHHTQEAQIHHQATQTTQIYKATLLLRHTCWLVLWSSRRLDFIPNIFTSNHQSYPFSFNSKKVWFVCNLVFDIWDTRPTALRGHFLRIQSKTTTPREVVLGKIVSSGLIYV